MYTGVSRLIVDVAVVRPQKLHYAIPTTSAIRVDGRLGDFGFPRKTATEAGQTAMMDYSSFV